jgi:DNA-binding transcriptional regulator LsrR (DeoR family)
LNGEGGALPTNKYYFEGGLQNGDELHEHRHILGAAGISYCSYILMSMPIYSNKPSIKHYISLNSFVDTSMDRATRYDRTEV